MSKASSSPKSLVLATATTTVFTSGNSQAVRLPKEFRVSSKTVEISKRGDEIVLRERPRTVGALMADLPVLSESEAAEFDETMQAVKAGLDPLEERDFSWMENDPARKAKGKSESSKSRSKKLA
jgi:antitoxin VapB